MDILKALLRFLRRTEEELIEGLCRFCQHLPIAFPGHAACENCERENGYD